MGTTNVTKEVVELTAIDNASRVLQGVQGAAQKLGATYDGLISKMGALGLAVAGLGSVGAFGAMIKTTIEGEAALLRLAEKTGNTVEALSSLGKVAKMSNTDMDDVGKGMQKLAKSMAEAESGTGKAGKVFEALGISVRDASTGALKPTQVVMQELGQKLMAMKDQTLAVAFAQETLGKAGANLLPFLYELASAGQLQAKVTAEQAKQAKEFEDNIVKLQAASKEFWRHLANDMLPTLNKYLEQLVEGKKIFGSWWEAMKGAGFTNPFRSIEGQQASARDDVARILAYQKNAADAPGFDAGVTARDLAAAQKKLAWYNFMQRQEVLERTGGTDTSDQVSRRFGAKATNVANPFGNAGGLPQKPEIDEATKAYLEALKIEEEATQATNDYYKKLGEQRMAETKKEFDDKALMWKQVFDEIDADQQRAIDEGAALIEKVQETDNVAHQLGLTLSSAAGRAIQGFGSLREVMRGLAADIAQIVFKSTVLKPLEKGIEGALDKINWGGLFGGGKAGGGPVMDGMTYLVGEQGPELLTMGGNGNITPNGAMGGGGTYYIDARGADAGGLARLEAAIRSVNGSIERRAVAAWQRASNSRGYATAVG